MILDSLFEKRTVLQNPERWLYDAFGATPSAAGISVNERTANELPAVWACIAILAKSLAQLPLTVFLSKERGREPATTHPLYKVLRQQPNPEMTAFTWKEMSQAHLVSWGNMYSAIERNGRGDVMELWPLLPDRTLPRRRGTELVYETIIGGRSYTLPARDVLHVRGLGYDGLVGWSPIHCQREALGWAVATQRFSARFFGNGAALRGVLEHPGTVTNKEQLRTDWQNLYGSTDNAFKTAVLEQGMKYTQIGIPPDDAQFVETRKLQRSEIATIFQVPMHFLGDPNTKYANREQESIDFVVYSLGAWCARWEHEINTKLLRPAEQGRYFVKFNTNALMRGDHASRATFYKAGIVDGWMTRNEVRELEDLNPLDGLDEPLQPLNMAVAGEEPEEPGAEPEPEEDEPEEEMPKKKPKEAKASRRAGLSARGAEG